MDSDSPTAARTAGQIALDPGNSFTAFGATFKSEFGGVLGARRSGRLGLRLHHRSADGDGR